MRVNSRSIGNETPPPRGGAGSSATLTVYCVAAGMLALALSMNSR